MPNSRHRQGWLGLEGCDEVWEQSFASKALLYEGEQHSNFKASRNNFGACRQWAVKCSNAFTKVLLQRMVVLERFAAFNQSVTKASVRKPWDVVNVSLLQWPTRYQEWNENNETWTWIYGYKIADDAHNVRPVSRLETKTAELVMPCSRKVSGSCLQQRGHAWYWKNHVQCFRKNGFRSVKIWLPHPRNVEDKNENIASFQWNDQCRSVDDTGSNERAFSIETKIAINWNRMLVNGSWRVATATRARHALRGRSESVCGMIRTGV